MFSSRVTWSTRQLGVQAKPGSRAVVAVRVTGSVQGGRLGPLELAHRATAPTATPMAAKYHLREFIMGSLGPVAARGLALTERTAPGLRGLGRALSSTSGLASGSGRP